MLFLIAKAHFEPCASMCDFRVRENPWFGVNTIISLVYNNVVYV